MGYRIRRKRRRDQGAPVQTKLEIGKPGDQFEREADAVADKVMMMPNVSSGMDMNPASSADINMKCAECEEEAKLQMKTEEEEDKVQRKSEEEEDEKVQRKPEEEEEKVQRMPSLQKDGDGVSNAMPSFEHQLQNKKGQGNTLPTAVNEELGGKIGADFDGVKIHTDSNAVQMSKQIGAQAFTHGNDIYFNKGKYNPSSAEGKHLLAHELTHVVQQGSADRVQRMMGDDHDLAAPRFSGVEALEAAYDDERYVMTGSSGDAVAALQQALIEIGYELPQYGVDGIFGGETKSAVETFQRDFGLSVDGIVGPQTMGTLDNIFTVEDSREKQTETYPDEEIVHDGDSPPGTTFPVREQSLAQLEGGGSSEVVQAKQDELKPPPDAIAKPPEIDQIDIDLPGQKLTVTWSDNKRKSGPYTISSGKGCPNTKGDPCVDAKRSDKDTYCTPAGNNFKVEGLGGEHYTNDHGDAMSWYVAFVASRGIGIHNAQTVTGTPKSHGCVRIANDVAKMIHNNVTSKTIINVVGDAPAKSWTLNKKKTQKGFKGCPLPPEKKKETPKPPKPSPKNSKPIPAKNKKTKTKSTAPMKKKKK